MIAFNYPLIEKEGRKVCEKFFYDSLHSEDNLYYYPKPNEYVEVDGFAFFSLKKDLTLDNYFIECLYRNNQLDVGLRNKIHPLLRDFSGIPAKVYKKCFLKKAESSLISPILLSLIT